MSLHHALKVTLALLVALGLAACSSKDGARGCLGGQEACATDTSGGTTTEPQVFGTGTANAFNCVATPSTNSVNSGEPMSIEFDASGGTPPYTISRNQSAYAGYPFQSSTRLYGLYQNTTAADIVVNRQALVTDSQGKTSTCPFAVTVRSATNPSTLGCTIAPSTAVAAPGQDVTFTFTATGGNGAYQFVNFRPDGYWLQPNGAITQTSATTATSTFRYTGAGARTASVVVVSGGYYAVCNTALNVVSVDLSVAASPSSSVPLNADLTVNATPIGFPAASPPSIQYTTSEPYIGIVNNGLSAKILNNDGKYHDFNVTVSASVSGTPAVTRTIHLTFTSSATLSCQLAGPSSPLVVPVPGASGTTSGTFTVSQASGSTLSEGLVIKEFYVDGVAKTVPAGTGSSISLDFGSSSAGNHTLTAKVVSANTQTPCNNGSLISLSNFKIYHQLSGCNVAITQDRVPAGSNVTAQASQGSDAYNGVGPFTVDILDADNDPSSVDTSGKVASGAQTQPTVTFRFLHSGNIAYAVRLTDSTSHTVKCSSTYYSY